MDASINSSELQSQSDFPGGSPLVKLDFAPQAAGLAAISLGLSRTFGDDHEMLKHGMVMYDALYAWCKDGRDETRTWNPAAYAQAS